MKQNGLLALRFYENDAAAKTLWPGLGLLMLLAEQVVDRLDGIERRERHFDEDRVPVAHRAIPQSRELQGLQFASVLALRADEARGGIHKLREVERLALVVDDATDEVHGIEMRTLGEHPLVGLVGLVDLARLQDLQAHRAVLVVGEERASAGLTHILQTREIRIKDCANSSIAAHGARTVFT